jgi:DNA repair exonuclease SbcCD ATPase subunit
MADEQTTQQDQQDNAQAASGAQGGGDNAGWQGTAPPAGGSLSQADVDRIVQERLSRERASAEKARAELQAQLDGYARAEEERKQAEMTEIDRAKAEAEKARKEAEEAKSEKAKAELASTRANLIAESAADLPTAFKKLVVGADADELTASIAEARKQYEELHSTVAGATLQSAMTMTDEQLEQAYGETGKAFAALRQGKPFNIGGPSNAAGNDDDTGTKRNTTLTPLQQMLAARNGSN